MGLATAHYTVTSPFYICLCSSFSRNVSHLSSRECLQVRNAFLEGGSLLGGGDGGLHVSDDPVDHVLLLHAPQHVSGLHLVVQPLLDSGVGSGKPASVFSLQLQADSLLLGSDDVLPSGGLLLLDLGKAGVNFVLPDCLQGSFFLIKLLVDRLSVGRALCLDKVGHDDGEAHAHVEVVLHDKVFLGSKEGGYSEESHVGASHTSLGVEGVEPLSREDQRLHRSPLNWPLAGREVDKVPLGKSRCGGQLPGSGEAAGHHGRSDSKPGEHDGSGGEELLDEDVLDALTWWRPCCTPHVLCVAH